MQLHRRLALIPRLSALLLAFPAIWTRPELAYAAASSDAQVWTHDESELAEFTELREHLLRWKHAEKSAPDMSAEGWQLGDPSLRCAACCSVEELVPSAVTARGLP
ncbi:MAG: hypothetical protein RLZZ450_850 [Pseudomonadota bacterium]|jgi:hypothetical protein